VAFAPDGKTLYAARDREVDAWEVPGGRRLRSLKPLPAKSYGFSAVALSPDGRSVAVANADADPAVRFAVLNNPAHTLRLLDARTGKEVGRRTWKDGPVSGLTYSAGGRVLAFQDAHAIQLWTADLGRQLLQIPTPDTPNNAFAFSPDGRTLAVAARNGGSAPYQIRLWEVASGKERARLPGHMGFVTTLAFSPDGKYLASGSDDATVRLWDLAKGKEVAPAPGHHGWVWGVTVSPDGKRVATAASDHTVRLWDAATGRPLRRLRGHEREVWAVRFSPAGGRGGVTPPLLATASWDGTARVWDADTGKELHRLGPHKGEVRSVAFSPDGKLLATGCRGSEPNIGLWDVATGREAGRLFLGPVGKVGPVYALAFSPDGKLLAVGEGTAIRLWDVARKRPVPWFQAKTRLRVETLAFTPDGKTLLSGSDSVQLWEVATGRERRRIPAPRRGDGLHLCAAALSPDGRRVACTYNAQGVQVTPATQVIHILDARTGAPVGRRVGHAGLIGCLAWAPDGRFLVSGSDDTTALVWDVAELAARPRRP
jgi:WD40 repeat protein